MNSTFFSSFSKTTFRDLYMFNIRDYHKHIYIFEYINNSILEFQSGFDVDNFVKHDPNSYLICFATDDENSIVVDLEKNAIVLLDTDSLDKNRDIKKCKSYLYVSFKDNVIKTSCKPKTRIYYDDFDSLSFNHINGFESVSIAEEKSFDLKLVKKKL